MRTYSASTIVLRRIDLGEKDRILTVYSREHGRLSAVAKGARRPGSKLSGASEPFTYSRMMLATGKELDVLTQAEIRESFPTAKSDIARIAYAVYILELIDHFVEDRQPNPDLFDTLLSCMYVLESGTDPEITARYFELHLLSLMGYDPHFDACLRCGRAIGKERVSFSPSLGGIVCGECGEAPRDGITVPGAAASYVRALRQVEPHKLKDLNVPPGARRDLARMLKWHIRYRLERELKSTEFIQTIGAYEQEPPVHSPSPRLRRSASAHTTD
jgi:DNA repair protein RecO (recombination protein O)